MTTDMEVLKDSSLYERSGPRYAKEQGLDDNEVEKFALALAQEYHMPEFLMVEATHWFDVMGDDGLVIYHPEFDIPDPDAELSPVDDFIVGTVLKQDDYTIIRSDEKLPQRFYKEDVEIRLTIIPKKPLEFEQVTVVTDGDVWGNNLKKHLKKFEGKRVKLTITEDQTSTDQGSVWR